jgi:hypothetical protein
VAAQEELAAVVAELQRADDPRFTAGGDRVDGVARDGEERVAVGLDEVGLVDARLLVVGGRVIRARACVCARCRSGGLRRLPLDERLNDGRPLPLGLVDVRLRVADERRAGVKSA